MKKRLFLNILVALGLGFMSPLPALAKTKGEKFPAGISFAPDLEILGFSRDGKYFGFIETAQENASGIIFASLTVVDVAKDSFNKALTQRIEKTEEAWTAALKAKGFDMSQDDNIPQSVMDEVTETLILETRVQLLRKYSAKLPEAGFAVPDLKKRQLLEASEQSRNRVSKKLDGGGDFEAALSKVSLKQSKDCEVDTKGFKLAFKHSNGKIAAYADKRLPASRFCPIDYKLHSAHSDKTGIAVIVKMYERGFEGVPKIRHLVVARKVL
jgi:predicted secreted protein